MCYDCVFVVHECTDGNWVTDLETTAAKIDLATQWTPSPKQGKSEGGTQGCALPGANVFDAAPKEKGYISQLDNVFGTAPSFEFIDVPMEDGRRY